MHWAVLALASLTLHGLPPCGTREECDEKAHEIVYDMTTEELFGQMTQLDIATILNHDRTLNETKVEQFAKLHVSSYFNSPYAPLAVFGVTVTNDGEVDGKDAVLLYMRQRTRGGNVPEAKRLIHFTKPTIQAKTSTRIHMHVSIHDLSIYVNHIGDGLKRRMVRTTYDFFLVDQHQREVALTWHMDEESSSSSSSWRRRDIDPPWHPPQGLSPARHRQSIFDANFDAATATA
ncbi:hypothetical protein Ae201684P_020834 [Aphanomyces euteiches]|nr:hypothetical protein Ae201684P_020834 [Aphanomyces euteiches]